MNKLHVVGALLILVLFLAGCTAPSNTASISVPSQNSETANINVNNCKTCFKTPYGEQICAISADCLINQATSVSDCKALEGTVLQRVEAYGRTVDTKFTQVDACILSVALKHNTPTECKSASAPNVCIMVYVATKNSTEACAIIDNETENVICHRYYAQAEKIADKCNNNPEFFRTLQRTACILRESRVNPEFNASLIEMCTLFTGSSGNEEHDASLCIATIASFKNWLSLCNSAGQYKESCYAEIALTDPSVDLESCKQAGVAYVNCYISVGIRTNDMSVCDKIPTNAKSYCLGEFATASADIRICNKIDDGNKAAECIRNIVSKKCPTYPNDITNCDISKTDCGEMKNAFMKTWQPYVEPNTCYYEVAKKNLDLDACNQITDESAKTNCVQLISPLK